MTPQMLEAGLENSGLEKEFDGVFSTDSVKAYKPDPRAYGMAVDAFRARIGLDSVRGLCRLGCRRRPVLRLSDLLGQSSKPAAGGARNGRGRSGNLDERSGRLCRSSSLA